MKKLSCVKNVALCALTIVLASACGEKKCIINGSIEGLENVQGLFVTIGENRIQMDTVQVSDGNFKYECALDPTVNLWVTVRFDGQTREQMMSANLIPDASRINLVLGKETKIEGSPLSEALKDLIATIGKAETEEEYLSIIRTAYNENPQNAIGAIFFRELAYELSLDEFDELLEKGSEKLKNDESLARLRDSKINEAKTGPGSEFVDFSGKTPEGNEVKLSDYVGKGNYTLVDFWASWCGPCMRSMPGMVNLWNNYHEKGLDIVGVAVWDGDNSASRIKMEEKGMLWPQIFVGDDKSSTDSYGILGIPHVILLDRDGIVIQRGIPDEEQLAEKIADLLN